jgi:hypothetical protein
MQRLGRHEWISKAEFHERLIRWWKDADDALVGDPVTHRRTAWLWVRDGHRLFRLNADTTREGVQEYLELLRSERGRIDWTIVESAAGKMTKTAFGPEQRVIRGFHLYVDPRTVPPRRS